MCTALRTVEMAVQTRQDISLALVKVDPRFNWQGGIFVSLEFTGHWLVSRRATAIATL